MNHKRQESTQHFLHTDRDLSFWIISLSFLAANCSALEILTVMGVAAKYGTTAVNFYWIGAIPGIACLICIVLPRYVKLGIRSVPEYFDRRFGHAARLLSAISFSLLMVAVAGITLCIAGQLLHFTLGWSFSSGVWSLTLAAAAFLLAGGLSAVLYADALQLLIFLLVLVPLTVITVRNAGSIGLLIARLPAAERSPLFALPLLSPHASIDLFGTVFGLGIVLGFSYWCGDFLLIQRLVSARNSREMLNAPSLAIGAKLFLPLLLVVPGLGAAARYGVTLRSGTFDLSLPRLVIDNYSGPLAAIAMATMIASLFFGVCGNISAGVAIFTSDIYKPLIQQQRSDSHYLNTGRILTLALILSAAFAAQFALSASSLMEYIQLVLSSLNVPIATVLLLGIFFPRIPARAGTPGLLAGTAVGILNLCLARSGRYGSGLGESFYGAIFAACASLLAVGIATLFLPAPASSLVEEPITNGLAIKSGIFTYRSLLTLASLAVMVALYVVYR